MHVGAPNVLRSMLNIYSAEQLLQANIQWNRPIFSVSNFAHHIAGEMKLSDHAALTEISSLSATKIFLLTCSIWIDFHNARS